LKKGKLVYVPSKVVLFDSKLEKGVMRCKETKEPIQVLCLGYADGAENLLRILHEGEQWSVHCKDVVEVANVN